MMPHVCAMALVTSKYLVRTAIYSRSDYFAEMPFKPRRFPVRRHWRDLQMCCVQEFSAPRW